MKMPMPMDYSVNVMPENYVCDTCGARGCKLWRDYQTFVEHQTLACCDCAGKSQEKDVSCIDDAGRLLLEPEEYGEDARSDQIGGLVPAIPTEDGDTFWGYSSVPDAGVAWWKKVRTRAMRCERCKKVIDLSRAAPPGSTWSSSCVGARGHSFCSMKCADEWEKDPANAQAVAESNAAWDERTPEERRRMISECMGYDVGPAPEERKR
jgi:hypothetical protein